MRECVPLVKQEALLCIWVLEPVALLWLLSLLLELPSPSLVVHSYSNKSLSHNLKKRLTPFKMNWFNINTIMALQRYRSVITTLHSWISVLYNKYSLQIYFTAQEFWKILQQLQNNPSDNVYCELFDFVYVSWAKHRSSSLKHSSSYMAIQTVEYPCGTYCLCA